MDTVTPTPIAFIMTAEQWHECQKKLFRPSKADLLSEFVDPAEEVHMTLEPDDDVSIALKAQKKQDQASRKTHRRQGSDSTAATEPMSLFDLGECELSEHEMADLLNDSFPLPQREESMRLEDCALMQKQSGYSLLESEDNECSCVDFVFRYTLENPCSDEEEEMMPQFLCC